jgi:hypothetical protein
MVNSVWFFCFSLFCRGLAVERPLGPMDSVTPDPQSARPDLIGRVQLLHSLG